MPKKVRTFRVTDEEWEKLKISLSVMRGCGDNLPQVVTVNKQSVETQNEINAQLHAALACAKEEIRVLQEKAKE